MELTKFPLNNSKGKKRNRAKNNNKAYKFAKKVCY